jgi:hypothetical protein
MRRGLIVAALAALGTAGILAVGGANGASGPHLRDAAGEPVRPAMAGISTLDSGSR